MHRIIVESFRPEIQENAKISGVALIPRKSRNDVFYPIDEVAAQDGRRFELGWNHDRDTPIIGYGTFHYNAELEQLFYEAQITDEKFAALARQRPLWVSIDGTVAEQRPWCHPITKNCMDIAIGLDLQRLDLVEAPGIPETTVQIIESYDSNSSLEHEPGKPESMTDKTTKEDKPCKCSKESKTKEQECPDGKKFNADTNQCEPVSDSGEKKENLGGGPSDPAAGVDQTKPGESPCGDGMKMDGDGKCIPANNDGAGASDSPTIESKVWAPNQDELNQKLDTVTSTLESLQTKIEDATKIDENKTREEFNKNLYSVTRLSPTSQGFEKNDLQYITREGKSQLKKFGSYSFDVDLSQEWVKESLPSRNRVSEAISFSGDPSNKVNVSNDIFVLPGGKYLKSIRDLVRFSDIPDGVDQIKLPKGDIPTQQTITEGSSNTAATHTATTVTLDADTVTGVPQTVTQSQVEDSNFSIFDYIAQTARGEVLDHEATITYDTAANAATPGLTVNSGGTGAFDVDYLLEALEYYEDQGYPTDFGNLYCVLHPEQMRQVRASTDITRFLQQGDATQTRTGKVTHLYGIELIPSNTVNTASSIHNAVVGVKGHTFWLGSKRELTIDMRKIPNESAFDWMWSQRKNAKVFDEASFVRIRSADA